MLKRKIFNLTFNPSFSELNEVPSTVRVKFAFVGEKNNQLHQETYCRDIMTSVLWGIYNKEEVDQSRFVYNFEDNPLDNTCTRISLHYTDMSTIKVKRSILHLKKNIKRLNMLEISFGIKPTSLYKTQNTSTLVVEGDKRWQETNWKISLYTYLLRYYSNSPNEPTNDNDRMAWLAWGWHSKLSYLLTNFNNSTWDGHIGINYHTGAHGFQGFLNKNPILLKPNKDEQCVV